MSLRLTALQARELSSGAQASGFDEAMEKIYAKIQEMVKLNRTELNYIFDSLTPEQKANEGFKQRVVATLRADGYTVKHVNTQDAGHPGDRPNDWITW